MFRSLKYRNFRLFFFGQFISLCGGWMQQTAQAWLVYRLTRDPLMLGLATMAGQFPVFLFGFYAGSVIDRTNHVALVRRTQFLAMLQAAALALVASSGRIQVWHVLALALALGMVNAFDMPARQLLVGELVEAEDRHNAIALNSTIVNASRILGPALAGLLIGWRGEWACFALNAASFLSVLAALLLIRSSRQKAPSAPGDIWQEIGRGMGYAVGQAPIRVVLWVLTAFSLAGLPIYVLLPVFAGEVLHAGAKGLGILSAASGLGATCGALLLARRASARGLASIIVRNLVLFGLCLGGMALCDRFLPACGLMWLLGYSAIQVLAGINTMLQELANDQYRGRVMSFYGMIFIGLAPLGSFLVGGLASRLGVSATVMLEAALCAALGLSYYRRLPRLLREGLPLAPQRPAELPLAL